VEVEISGKIKDFSRLQIKRFTAGYRVIWGYARAIGLYFNTYIAPLT
jgi:hypothetical protein